jgi:polysaccharide biosynthesis protein PslH
MRVLWISPKLPYPPESGDKLRQFNLIRKLSSKTEISLIAFTLTKQEEDFAGHMNSFCPRVKTFYFHGLSNVQRIRSIVTSTNPYYVARYQNADVSDYIQNEMESFRPDVVQIEHTYLAEYLRRIPSHLRRPSILTKHNIDAHLAWQSYKFADGAFKKMFWWLEWKKMALYEPRADNLFSSVVVMSNTDKQEILSREKPPASVYVVENGVDTQKLKPLSPVREPVMLFLGALDYLPNQDAAIYICSTILPLLKKSVENPKILLVGRKPSSEILNLQSESVEVYGDVPDVEPFYERASIAMVPLRAGSGSRLKILEAMALGRPVVSTSKGAEGLEIEPGKDFMLADDPKDFVESIRDLLIHKDLYENIASRARETVERKYDWSEAANKMTRIYETLCEAQGKI